MFSPEILAAKVTDTNTPSPEGVSCRFVKLDDNWGIKIYICIEDRDSCYILQEEMSKRGFGPKVGIKFDVGENYCYITQVARPLVNAYTQPGDEYCSDFARFNHNPIVRSMINDIYNKMKKAGFDNGDRHVCNYGILDKMIVCIDFGND